MPAHPAGTFHEAIQALWLAYMVVGDGLGRPDVYLNDFYISDLAAGRITPGQALELIECFMIKLHGETASSKFNVSSIQTMTLAGQKADGSDATNDLTRLFLKAIRNIRLLRPTIYVRCHDRTPQDVLMLSAVMLGEGLAEPNFYFDEPIVEGLVRNVVTPEVARDYALGGCTEVCSPGRGNWGSVSGWINPAMAVDDALRECAADGIVTSQKMWDAIGRHLDDLAEIARVSQQWLDDREKYGNYEASLLMPCCLDKCVDFGHGGAESALGQWEAMGLPNCVDMVYAVETLACEGGESLSDLFNLLDSGDPGLLTRLRGLPKFGNGVAKVDQIGRRIVHLLSGSLERRRTELRSSLTLGHLAGGENMHISYGMVMGATLDGRAAGQTLADSLAGSQGCTISGPTAVVRSVCTLDHSNICAGNVSTLRLSRADFATPEAFEKVVSLIRAFGAMGGSQLQINLVDAATLRDAQNHPERHAGLLVRVAGYSADFTSIGKTLQDEIIARTEGLRDR